MEKQHRFGRIELWETNHPEIEGVQKWMIRKGLNTLHSISLWNQRDWQDWKISTIPANLEVQWRKLRQLIKGATPMSYDEEDDFL